MHWKSIKKANSVNLTQIISQNETTYSPLKHPILMAGNDKGDLLKLLRVSVFKYQPADNCLRKMQP